MAVVDRVDRTLLFGIARFLACIAFIPFPTRFVAEHFRDDDGAAAFTYGLTMTAAAICATFIWFYAARGRRLIAETTAQEKVDALSRALIPAVPINAAATLVAVWSPYVALALFGALQVFYVLGGSLFGRD